MAEENQIDLENLSITELAQLSQHVNSGNFPTSQRQKVEALVWRKIKSVAENSILRTKMNSRLFNQC